MIGPNFTPNILRFEEVESTNSTAKDLAQKGLAEGTVVLARAQTAGRGRDNRKWHSPKGGLYFSVVLYPKDPKRSTDLALLAGVAVSQAVKQILPKSKDVSVKWPNDVLVDWKKIGGILCESLGPAKAGAVIVGIGINLNAEKTDLAPFLENPFSATSFKLEAEGSDFLPEDVLQVVLSKLFALYRLYHEEGFTRIQFLWDKNCKMIGRRVELRETGWRDVKSRDGRDLGVVVGTLLGIDDSGAILIANARGERFQYFSGEITCYWP